MRASDIHIEPGDKALRIRQRIDGQLHETILNEVNIAAALVLRLKLMAGLDISEKRLPQDGRFHMEIKRSSYRCAYVDYADLPRRICGNAFTRPIGGFIDPKRNRYAACYFGAYS